MLTVQWQVMSADGMRVPKTASLSSLSLRCWILALFQLLVLAKISAASNGQEVKIGREHTVSGYIGDSATLPCDVDLPSCGKVYFITWTKNVSNEWERVYFFSDTYSKPLGQLAGPDRATFILENNSAELHISGLTVNDEGTYKCDVTYVQGKCPSLSFTKLYTLIVPSHPDLQVDGTDVQNGTSVGPYTEGSTFVLDCKSSHGRPAPQVVWRNVTKPLPMKTTITPKDDGTFEVVSTARFVLSRWDLGTRLECRVESNATIAPLVKWLKLDVHVQPMALRVRGPTTPVVAGEMVSLTCTVEGARPAANITWYNRSEVVHPQPMSSKDLMSDTTYRTTSTLVFIASRHDHHGEFFCKGTNEVQRKRNEAPLLQAIKLEVLYPPAVEMVPSGKQTVNESGVATLSCSYNANPPNITEVGWYKDGEVFLRDGERRIETRSDFVVEMALSNVSRLDSGSFTCYVRNAFGRANSTEAVFLDVWYVPKVHISLSTNEASETTMTTLTLLCEANEGNPLRLSAVRWFHNSVFLTETTEPMLHVKHATREKGGNYSCEGLNSAGWSYRSQPEELVVKYAPSQATIQQIEEDASKGQPVTLLCEVDDPGYPPASSFRWYRNGFALNARVSSMVTDPLSTSTIGNYSCAAENIVGKGIQGYYFLKGKAPPAFVEMLPEVGGALKNASVVRLVCRVECEPVCDVQWYRNNETLQGSKFFMVENEEREPEFSRNIFKSVASTLTWSMNYLPSGSFDNNNFSCKSSSNAVGPGVFSTMTFRVEYPPEDVRISIFQVELIEGDIPDDLVCSASSHPLGDYVWKVGEKTVARGPVLTFNTSVSRDMSGNYTCMVANRHGFNKADAVIVVHHRPECVVRKDYDEEGNVILVCSAVASPSVLNFTWLKNNLTIREEQINEKRQESTLTLAGETSHNYGVYSCIAGNAIGYSDPCHLQITALPSPSGWVQLLLQEENLIIVAGAAGSIVILMVLLVITAAAVVIRRRLRGGNEKTEMKERQRNSVLRVRQPPMDPQEKVPNCFPVHTFQGEIRPLVRNHPCSPV